MPGRPPANDDHRPIAHRLFLERAAVQAVERLTAAGVGVVLLKGPVTAARLYRGQARPMADIDLLVEPARLAEAERVLAGLGYRQTGVLATEADWRRDDGALIDLHFTLSSQVPLAPGPVWACLSGHLVSFELHGRPVPVLDEPAHALHMAVHAADSGPHRPKPVADLDRAVARFDLATWRAALVLAGELRAVPALVAALRIHATDGDGLADALGLPATAAMGDRLAAAAAGGPGSVLARLRHRPWRHRLAEIRRWLVPTRAETQARLAMRNVPAWLPSTGPARARLAVLRAWQLGQLGLAAARAARARGYTSDM
jgi:Uncharacterised nucleotidyltransferase